MGSYKDMMTKMQLFLIGEVVEGEVDWVKAMNRRVEFEAEGKDPYFYIVQLERELKRLHEATTRKKGQGV